MRRGGRRTPYRHPGWDVPTGRATVGTDSRRDRPGRIRGHFLRAVLQSQRKEEFAGRLVRREADLRVRSAEGATAWDETDRRHRRGRHRNDAAIPPRAGEGSEYPQQVPPGVQGDVELGAAQGLSLPPMDRAAHGPQAPEARASLASTPAGHPFPPEAYVFGDEVGQRVGSSQKAWGPPCSRLTAIRRRGWGRGNLAPPSREAYQEIGLQFHGLRHEAGSRWLEAGMPIHHVKELLGHSNISTTDTYLNAGRLHLRESMDRAEERRSGTNCHIARGTWGSTGHTDRS